MRCGKCEKELYACKCAEKKDEPVIDRTMAVRIATQLGWEPKREWVGLTDEEINALHYELKCAAMGATSTLGMYRILERALREKNT